MPLYKIERELIVRQTLLVSAPDEDGAKECAELGQSDDASIDREKLDYIVKGKVLTIEAEPEDTIDRCPECGRVNGLKVAMKGTP